MDTTKSSGILICEYETQSNPEITGCCIGKVILLHSASIAVKRNRYYSCFSKVPQVVNLFVQELGNIGTMRTGTFDVLVKNLKNKNIFCLVYIY